MHITQIQSWFYFRSSCTAQIGFELQQGGVLFLTVMFLVSYSAVKPVELLAFNDIRISLGLVCCVNYSLLS